MPRSTRDGFTLVELLIVLAIAVLILALGVPSLLNLLARQRLEGPARDISTLAHRARQEAVSRGAPAVLLADGDAVVAFLDIHGETATDPPDGVFNPIAGSPYRSTDFEVGRRVLPNQVTLGGPSGSDGVVDFTDFDGTPKAIFEPDGSIRDTGGFRLADSRGNFLEIRIAPRATGRVAMLKFDDATSTWRANGEGGHSWDWK
ncbi:MAG TPA: GspH/FimT family pseudopilin [Thermoanaerobaculia bacterium]|nr:GspH/FimT family pseudopilin [Thermoanaerobaculia bacterium]